MDDNAPKENPPPDFNKLDLSQLQGFSFGTQWMQEKTSAPERHGREDQGGERPRRDDRRDGGGGGPDRRDRRSFRRPAGPGSGEGGAPAPGGAQKPGGAAGPGGGAPERRDFSGDRDPRQEGGGEYRGGPRREGPGGGERGPRSGYAGRGAPQDRGPYESPYYAATFYPEDTSFNTLVQTIRKSCRTVELFEIARTVVAKTDRFVVVVVHKASASAPAPAARPAGSGAEAEPPAPPPAKPLFHVSVPDGIPFESDEAAVAHVLSHHLDKFFDQTEVEVEPPKGNFQVINKCGVTGELLGPPNYHRYNQIVQQHHAAKVSRMPMEAFRNRIETIRDPEVVNQWLAKMKKTTRYTWKLGAKPAVPAAVVASETQPAEGAAPAAESGAEENSATVAPAVAAPAVPTFDTLEDARTYLLTTARDKVVRTTEHARFHGKVAETMPPGEIRRAVEGALERQRRFPLDTANALRGRLRREHFTIFKKGSKGVSYVCAVKRKFRVPGQTFSDSIGALIGFIEANPMVRASELPAKFLGLALPAPSAPETPAASAAAAPAAGAGGEAAPAPAPEAPKPEPVLSIDDRTRLGRMQGDLIWLVHEGYVTEFIDGRLFAPPPMVEARKKEIESEEHDPENFPEAPASPSAADSTAPVPPAAPAVAAEPEALPAETPRVEAPAVEAPAVGAPAAEAPVAEAPSVEPTPADAPATATAAAPSGAETPAPTENASPATEGPKLPPVEDPKLPPVSTV
ncbi:MAG: hypothetical protein HY736_18600 [Verrucomicrobia bacterium]|nr:hypothetical protein [Verrucomicrobiota bacterium]